VSFTHGDAPAAAAESRLTAAVANEHYIMPNKSNFAFPKAFNTSDFFLRSLALLALLRYFIQMFAEILH